MKEWTKEKKERKKERSDIIGNGLDMPYLNLKWICLHFNSDKCLLEKYEPISSPKYDSPVDWNHRIFCRRERPPPTAANKCPAYYYK